MVGINVYRGVSDLKEADVGNCLKPQCPKIKDEDCAEYLNRFGAAQRPRSLP
jgi:hypothetical protein